MEVTRATRTDQSGSDCQCLVSVAELDSDVDPLPTTRETLQAIGRRLSRSYSEHDLSVIASRETSCFSRSSTGVSGRRWLTAISGSTSIRPSSSTWPSPSSRSRSGSPTRASRRRTCRSKTAIRPGPSIGSRLSQGGSDWASMVSTVRRWLTTSSSSGREDGEQAEPSQSDRHARLETVVVVEDDACSARASVRPTMRTSRFRRCPLIWWTPS